MPTTRSQAAGHPPQPAAAANPPAVQRTHGTPALTLEQFEDLISDFSDPEPTKIDVLSRKLETHSNCNDVRCGAIPMRQYPGHIFEHVCPHFEVFPPDSSQELFVNNPPSTTCIHLYGADEKALFVVLNFLWECFRYKRVSETRYKKVLPTTRDAVAYHQYYNLMRVSDITRLPQELIQIPAAQIIWHINQNEEVWPHLVELLYSEPDGCLSGPPNFTIRTDASFKAQLVFKIADVVARDELTNHDALWDAFERYPQFHTDLEEPLAELARQAQGSVSSSGDEDDEDGDSDDRDALGDSDAPSGETKDSSSDNSDDSPMEAVSDSSEPPRNMRPRRRNLHPFFEEEHSSDEERTVRRLHDTARRRNYLTHNEVSPDNSEDSSIEDVSYSSEPTRNLRPRRRILNAFLEEDPGSSEGITRRRRHVSARRRGHHTTNDVPSGSTSEDGEVAEPQAERTDAWWHVPLFTFANGGVVMQYDDGSSRLLERYKRSGERPRDAVGRRPTLGRR